MKYFFYFLRVSFDTILNKFIFFISVTAVNKTKLFKNDACKYFIIHSFNN